MAHGAHGNGGFPNLHVKISGLGMYSSGIVSPQARQVIRDVIQIFGAERHDLRQQLPAGKAARELRRLLWYLSYGALGISEAEQRAVLHDNAAKFYRI